MKKLCNKFLFLIICMMLFVGTPVLADKPSTDVFEVPSLEKAIESTSIKSVEELPATEIQEENIKKSPFQDSFWILARNVGLGVAGLILLFFIFNLLKKVILPASSNLSNETGLKEDVKVSNLDQALKSFIRKNI